MIAHICEYASTKQHPSVSLIDIRGFFDICSQQLVRYRSQEINANSVAVATSLIGYVFPAILSAEQSQSIDAKVRTTISQLARSPFFIREYGARRTIDDKQSDSGNNSQNHSENRCTNYSTLRSGNQDNTLPDYLPVRTHSILCENSGWRFEQKEKYLSHLTQINDRLLQRLSARYIRHDHFVCTALSRFALPLFNKKPSDIDYQKLTIIDEQYGTFVHPFPSCLSQYVVTDQESMHAISPQRKAVSF
jgi:hypothetical protein